MWLARLESSAACPPRLHSNAQTPKFAHESRHTNLEASSFAGESAQEHWHREQQSQHSVIELEDCCMHVSAWQLYSECGLSAKTHRCSFSFILAPPFQLSQNAPVSVVARRPKAKDSSCFLAFSHWMASDSTVASVPAWDYLQPTYLGGVEAPPGKGKQQGENFELIAMPCLQ